MPTKRTDLDLDDLAERYLSGATQKALAEAVGVDPKTISRALTKAGVALRSGKEANALRPKDTYARREDIDGAAVVASYLAGESAHSLGKRWRCAPGTIAAMLKAAGTPIRDNHQAQTIRMMRPPKEERRARMAPAIGAWRGKQHREESVAKIAARRQDRGVGSSDGERQLFEMLVERGLQPIPELAVGRYNIDLAIGNVGVEVLGGWWHKSKRHATRTRYLLDLGWNLVFVWVHRQSYPLRVAAADYVVAFAQETQRNPSPVGEYRMIRGTGKEVARGRGDLDELPGIPAGH